MEGGGGRGWDEWGLFLSVLGWFGISIFIFVFIISSCAAGAITWLRHNSGGSVVILCFDCRSKDGALLGLVMFSGQFSWEFSFLLVLYLLFKPTGLEGIHKTVQGGIVNSARRKS